MHGMGIMQLLGVFGVGFVVGWTLVQQLRYAEHLRKAYGVLVLATILSPFLLSSIQEFPLIYGSGLVISWVAHLLFIDALRRLEMN